MKTSNATRLWRAGVILLLTAILMVAMGADEPGPTILRGNGLELVSTNGRFRMTIGEYAEGQAWQMIIYDDATPITGGDPDGPAVSLHVGSQAIRLRIAPPGPSEARLRVSCSAIAQSLSFYDPSCGGTILGPRCLSLIPEGVHVGIEDISLPTYKLGYDGLVNLYAEMPEE